MDGVEIRSFQKEDITYLNQLRRTRYVCDNILSLVDETKEQTYCYFTEENTHIFIASYEDHPIGYIKLKIDSEIRRKHKGVISIAVDKNYHGKGVGSKLFEAIIDLSKNWLMLKKLELTVLKNNEKAIALYERFGFELEGVLKKDTVVNGIYEDVVFMGRLL